jgi:hypothetical protein
MGMDLLRTLLRRGMALHSSWTVCCAAGNACPRISFCHSIRSSCFTALRHTEV